MPTQMAKQRKEPSIQQLKLLAVFEAAPRDWFYNSELAKRSGSRDSTVRHLTTVFFEMKILERVLGLGGGFKYRLAAEAPENPYYRQLKELAAHEALDSV